MIAKVTPWGQLDYILSHFGRRDWVCISSGSFEERCTTVPKTLSDLGVLRKLGVLRIEPPADSLYRLACEQGINESMRTLTALPNACVHDVGLLDPLGSSLNWISNLSPAGSSVILDITAMPKRYFMLIVNKLMDNVNVTDLIVTYAKPDYYPEGALAVDHEPIAGMIGLTREEEFEGASSSIIGAGFVQFSLSEYLEQARGVDLSILLPFPPGSPSSRRNWNLLHRMDPNIEMRASIRRIHSMDFFSALRWMNSSITGNALAKVNLIPLGPKPHSLAMALAYRKNKKKSSVLYAQPHSYRVDYSIGISSRDDGKLDVVAYCLKRAGVEYA